MPRGQVWYSLSMHCSGGHTAIARRALDRAGIAAFSFSGASFAYLYSYRYL